MDFKYIKNLLDKYWAGESSLEEEATLRNYFQGDDIAPELKSFQPMFQFFTAASETESEQDVLSQMDFEEDNIIPLASRNSPFYIFKRIAAILILAVSSFWAYQMVTFDNDVQAHQLDTFEEAEAEEAYRTTQAALQLISAKLNKGKSSAAAGISKVRVMDGIFNNKKNSSSK